MHRLVVVLASLVSAACMALPSTPDPGRRDRAADAARSASVPIDEDLPPLTELPPQDRWTPTRPGDPPLNETGVFSVLLAGRGLDDGTTWGDLDRQAVFGLEFCRKPDDHLGFCGGVLANYWRTSAGGGDIDNYGIEAYVGPKLFLPIGFLELHAGLGASVLYQNLEALRGDRFDRDTDWSFGAYGTVGLLLKVSDIHALGVELRTVQLTDAKFFDTNGDMDYTQAALVWSMFL